MPTPQTLTPLEIAKIACDIETDGSDFYKAGAAAVSNPDARNTFNSLALEEAQHMNSFRGLYAELDALSGGSESSVEVLFNEDITHYLRVLTRGRVFPGAKSSQAWFASHPTVEEIIRVALEIEKSSILFYTEIAAHNAFIASRQLIETVLREEKSHLVKLNRLLVEVCR